MTILINGESGSQIDVLDRGLQYGDGVFETIAVHHGRAPLWERHMQRLRHGCERLGIPVIDTDMLAGEARQLYRQADRCVLKIIVTRGTGGRGYALAQDPVEATRVVMTLPWSRYPGDLYRSGIKVRLCRTRLGAAPHLAGLKHLNRLDQVLARSEWQSSEISEGLMLDGDGHVIEGTMTNLFIVRDGRLYTPDISQAGVAGVMRGLIMELAAAAGRECSVQCLRLDDIEHAHEVFLCNSVVGIWPVRRIEQWSYAPGPVTQQLSAMVAKHDRAFSH